MTTERPAALVTGAARRLGRAIAVALAGAGYDIALHCHASTGMAKETAAEIESAGRQVMVLHGDLADVTTPERLVTEAQQRFPGLLVVVNSASRYGQASICETTATLYDAQMSVNLRAPFFLTQAFARIVRRGHIINIADNKVEFTQPAYAAYLLSKKALVELTRLAAVELAPHIRVNAVAPGIVLPAETRTGEYLAWRTDAVPLKARGTPVDVTDAILYLLHSTFITGQVLTVDGGESVARIGRHAANAPQG
jgi:NAD(P)-dependent dehydrogenase (short-subunit alcohol dehydrogenase family)